ncbi:hypothetical protein M0813_15037 [Anaeramoeba flamelloides]|uniref:Uncharacterized protein n=1 Tax=Anaeramoeba flamelloides TaxID=1746091 RepID=A0ABQ8Z3U0_9EUKA|nr:hypothetical protein M0813_15037 [Anaeramoeba flamelloides]
MEFGSQNLLFFDYQNSDQQINEMDRELFLSESNNSQGNIYYDKQSILKKKQKNRNGKQKKNKKTKQKKNPKEDSQQMFEQTENFEPFFQLSNEETIQESEILFGQFETSDYDEQEANDNQGVLEKENDRFSTIFDSLPKTNHRRKKQSQRAGLKIERGNNMKNQILKSQNDMSTHETQIFSSRSIPIPIDQKFHKEESGSGSEEEKIRQNEFAFTFIEPHKYIESLQTEMERELSKSFNVPLKRVPSWRI